MKKLKRYALTALINNLVVLVEEYDTSLFRASYLAMLELALHAEARLSAE